MGCGKAGRRCQGCWRRWGRDWGSTDLAEIISTNPRPTSADIAPTGLDQPGQAASANLGTRQPTSINSAEGPSKCSESKIKRVHSRAGVRSQSTFWRVSILREHYTRLAQSPNLQASCAPGWDSTSTRGGERSCSCPGARFRVCTAPRTVNLVNRASKGSWRREQARRKASKTVVETPPEQNADMHMPYHGDGCGGEKGNTTQVEDAGCDVH
ncbi:hypothetical protein C8R44DRAFT_725926 [Mycena epipterygia]|nr:hypothetical protein C8R44DRAFT_725926 [Mycena epipterygia]